MVINKVKVTHQGEGHIKVKVKYLLPFQLFAKFYLLLSWDDKNWLKFIGKTNRLKISLQNAYFYYFVYFSDISDRNLIILYKFT